MACDDGFGFQADVSSPVYGYCSGNAEGNNVFTLDGTDGCYGIYTYKSKMCVCECGAVELLGT